VPDKPLSSVSSCTVNQCWTSIRVSRTTRTRRSSHLFEPALIRRSVQTLEHTEKKSHFVPTFFRLPKVLRRRWNEPSGQSNTRWSCEARRRLPVASAPDGRGPILRLRRKRSVTVAGPGQQDIHAHGLTFVQERSILEASGTIVNAFKAEHRQRIDPSSRSESSFVARVATCSVLPPNKTALRATDAPDRVLWSTAASPPYTRSTSSYSVHPINDCEPIAAS
jgi:hypothetical protein